MAECGICEAESLVSNFTSALMMESLEKGNSFFVPRGRPYRVIEEKTEWQGSGLRRLRLPLVQVISAENGSKHFSVRDVYIGLLLRRDSVTKRIHFEDSPVITALRRGSLMNFQGQFGGKVLTISETEPCKKVKLSSDGTRVMIDNVPQIEDGVALNFTLSTDITLTPEQEDMAWQALEMWAQKNGPWNEYMIHPYR